MSKYDEIVLEIEVLRLKLYGLLGDEYDLNSANVLALSQELDKLIVSYYDLRSKKRKLMKIRMKACKMRKKS